MTFSVPLLVIEAVAGPTLADGAGGGRRGNNRRCERMAAERRAGDHRWAVVDRPSEADCSRTLNDTRRMSQAEAEVAPPVAAACAVTLMVPLLSTEAVAVAPRTF